MGVPGLRCPVAHGIFPRTRDQTHVPRVGRQVLTHCATREVLPFHFFKADSSVRVAVLDRIEERDPPGEGTGL